MAVLDLGKVVPEKGIDYFTEADIESIVADVESEITVPTKTSDLTNDSGFIDNTVNNLTNYELKTNTGSTIALSIDSSTYVMTMSLKNSAGTILNTQTVDLPLETMVVSGSYDSTNKKIVLTLKNGSTIDVPVGDLVSGLQAEITSSNKLSSDLVDDTNNTNKFVTASEKTTWNGKQDVLTAGDNITIVNNVISATGGGDSTCLGKVSDYTSSSNFLKFDELEEGVIYVILNDLDANGSMYVSYTDANDKTWENTYSVGTWKATPYLYVQRNESTSGFDTNRAYIWYEYLGSPSMGVQKDRFFTQGTTGGTMFTQAYQYATYTYADLSSNQTISGKKTFSTLPESSVVPTTDDQLVNKKYVDDNAGGGSDLPIYVLEISKNLTDSGIDITSATDKASAGAVINAIYNSGKNYGVIILRSTSQWYEKTYIMTMKDTVATTRTQFEFFTCASANLGGNGVNTFYIWKRLAIAGTWSNGVFTCSSLYWDVSDPLDRSQILFKNNVYSYTPTNDYNPATKKYVDDAIASAITTTLGGNY